MLCPFFPWFISVLWLFGRGLKRTLAGAPRFARRAGASAIGESQMPLHFVIALVYDEKGGTPSVLRLLKPLTGTCGTPMGCRPDYARVRHPRGCTHIRGCNDRDHSVAGSTLASGIARPRAGPGARVGLHLWAHISRSRSHFTLPHDPARDVAGRGISGPDLGDGPHLDRGAILTPPHGTATDVVCRGDSDGPPEFASPDLQPGDPPKSLSPPLSSAHRPEPQVCPPR